MRWTGRRLEGNGEKGAVNHVERPPDFRHVRSRIGIEVAERELNDWRRINDAAISLTEATCPGSNRLLTNIKIIAVCT